MWRLNLKQRNKRDPLSHCVQNGRQQKVILQTKRSELQRRLQSKFHSWNSKLTSCHRLLCPKSKCALKEYRKTYIAPLRQYLKIAERLMCANEWNKIPYAIVPSRFLWTFQWFQFLSSCRCMSLNKAAFQKHDEERFKQYLDAVKTGKTTIKAAQLFPHELCTKYINNTEASTDEVTELQWKALVQETIKSNSSPFFLGLAREVLTEAF